MTFLHQKSFGAVFFDDAVGPLSPVDFVTALRKDTMIECRQVPCILMSARADEALKDADHKIRFPDYHFKSIDLVLKELRDPKLCVEYARKTLESLPRLRK